MLTLGSAAPLARNFSDGKELWRAPSGAEVRCDDRNMSPVQDKLQQIFGEALTKASPEDREHYLAEVCGQNEGLRRQMDSLLEAHNQAAGFLKQGTNPAEWVSDVRITR